MTFPYKEVHFQWIHTRSFHGKRHYLAKVSYNTETPQSFHITRFTQMISS